MNYIVMRLTTGEQVMATLDAEDHTHLHISHPLIVKMTPSIQEGRMIEHVTAQPFCQFSADKYYDIPKSIIVFVKPLHEALIAHYMRIVESYEDTVLVKPPREERSLQWDEEPEEEMTADQFREKIDRLADFLQSSSSESEEEDIKPIIIDGNDTIH